jgi:hypothetical protein
MGNLLARNSDAHYASALIFHGGSVRGRLGKLRELVGMRVILCLGSRFVLGRRSLRLGVGFSRSLGLGLGLCVLHSQLGELRAVIEERLDQRTLIVNRASLLYDQQGHEAIRDQEQHDEHRKHGMLGFGLLGRNQQRAI